MKITQVLILSICGLFFGHNLSSQTAREILQKTKERIDKIDNCKVVTTWESTNLYTSVKTTSTSNDYFQKNELDTMLGYSFVLKKSNDGIIKTIAIYDGCQGMFINNNQYRMVTSKEHFLSSTFNFLLNGRATLATVLSSDSVKIVQKKDTVINQVKHYVVHISSPSYINIFNMVEKHYPEKPGAEIEFVLNSNDYLPKLFTIKLLYPEILSHLSQFTVFKADSIIEVNKMYPNFNFINFMPPGCVDASSVENEKNINHKNPFSWDLESLGGENISLKSLKGKVVLVDFFTLYCGPCLMATPELIKLKNEFMGKNIEVVGIDNSKNSNIALLKKYTTDHKINYPLLVNGYNAAQAYKIQAIPTFILFDQKGRVVHYKTGFSKEVIEEIKIKIIKLL